MAKHKTHYEDCDVLVVGGGMAGTGATFEARHWGRDMKIICVEKANIDRSGACCSRSLCDQLLYGNAVG
jgi:adenylylsulfate reductase subunit A